MAEIDVPAHVPKELVRDFDFVTGLTDRPHDVIAQLHDGPRTIFSRTQHSPVRKGGTWIPTKAADLRTILQDPETFSSKGFTSFSMALGETWDLIPIELDPPEHSKFRAVLNPLFSPKRLASMEEKAHQRAAVLIDGFRGNGECNFVMDFAREYPTVLFLDLMGLPQSDLGVLMEWERDIFDSFDPRERIAALRGLTDYIRDLIRERRKAPKEDFVSFAVGVQVDGRSLTDDEVLGMCSLVFTAGLDTVVSSSGWMFRHLAEHPEQQAWLRADKARIPAALEELFRLYSVVVTQRTVTRDTEAAGVVMKAGDYVTCHTLLGSRDPAEFEQPNVAVLDRAPNRHFAFSYGVHRCIGATLAKLELRVAMEEFFNRIPTFRMKPDAPVKAIGGAVLSMSEMHLCWDV